MFFKNPLSYFPTMILLFVLTGCRSDDVVLYHNNMNFHKDLRLDQDSTLLVISGNNTIASKEPVRFKAGKYVISFKAFGSVAGDEALPVLVTDIADSLTIKYSRIEVEPKSYTIKFELQNDVTGKLNLSFINDYADEHGDRNIYLYFPIRVFRF